MTPTQKELQIKLTFTGDATGGVRALQQLAAEAQRTAAAASRVGLGGFGGPASPGHAEARASGPSALAALPAGGAAGAGQLGFAVTGLAQTMAQLAQATAAANALKREELKAQDDARDRARRDQSQKERAGRPLEIIRNLQLGGVAGYAGQVQGYADAAGGAARMLGANRAAAAIEGVGARVAAPIALGIGSMELGAAAAPLMYDHRLTQGQRERYAFRKFAPFGGTLLDAHDSISGRNARMAENEIRASKREIGVQGQLQISSSLLSLNPELAGNEARYASTSAAKPIHEGYVNRSAPGGEKAYAERQRTVALEREIAKAEREAAVATEQRVAAQKELERLDGAIGRQGDYRNVAQMRLRWEEGTGRDAQLRGLKQSDTIVQSLQGQRVEAARNFYEAQKTESTAKGQIGQAQARGLVAEASSLEFRAAQSANSAQRLGGMGKFARQDAVRALERLQAYGPEMLSERELSAAQAVAPNTTGKILEKAGKNSPEFEALKRLAPDDNFDDPEELRKKAAGKRDQASDKESEAANDFARAAADAGRDLGRLLREAMKEMIDAAKREFDAKLLQQKGSQG